MKHHALSKPTKAYRGLFVWLAFATQAWAGQQAIPLFASPLQFNAKDTTFTAKIPAGYTLELLNRDMQRPRLMTFHPSGELLIGSRSGHIYRLKPPYRQAESLVTLPDYPHSLAFRDGKLWIAQTHGLYAVEYKAGQPRINPQDIKRIAALPGGRGHNSRSVAIGPDRRIYLSLGISGNCSHQYLGKGYTFDNRRGGILLLDETTQPPQWQSWASGLRNPVGFAWRNGRLYASNNGPDHWGFHHPGETFMELAQGDFAGMPWYQTIDGKLKADDCISHPPPLPKHKVRLPDLQFPARNAPMGVAIVPRGRPSTDWPTDWPPDWQGDAVVALHGSWGTLPNGSSSGEASTRRPPKLVLVRFNGTQILRYDTLVSGFQDPETGQRWARPLGVDFGPDGDLYFTSDGGINGLFRLRKLGHSPTLP